MNTATTLQGSLGDIAIDDVLRLLDARSRSGLLVVNPPNPLRLVIADGAIVMGGSSSTMALGRYLLAGGIVSAEQLEELFGLVRGRTGERQNRALDDLQVLDTLVENVPHDDMAAAVRRQAVATVFEMMLLGEADLVFTEADPHPLAARFRAPIGEILQEATSQAARWDDLQRRVGGDGARLRRVRRLAVQQTPVILDAVDWAALSEIDEHSTVGQIAHRLGLGRFDAAEVLGGLVERGLAEPAG